MEHSIPPHSMNVFYAAIAKTAGDMLIVYVRTFIGPQPSGTYPLHYN